MMQLRQHNYTAVNVVNALSYKYWFHFYQRDVMRRCLSVCLSVCLPVCNTAVLCLNG